MLVVLQDPLRQAVADSDRQSSTIYDPLTDQRCRPAIATD